MGTSASFNRVYVASDADLEVSSPAQDDEREGELPARAARGIWTGKKGYRRRQT
jgi:hypothetical protein